MHSTINAIHLALDGFLNNAGHTSAVTLADQFSIGVGLDTVFPITNQDQLELLNNKLQTDKEFKLNLVIL